MSTLLIASIGEDLPGVIAVLIPIVALMIPIVVLLTRHQQRMTEILHGVRQTEEVEALRREVADLRSLVQQQTYMIDRLQSPVLVQKDTTVMSS